MGKKLFFLSICLFFIVSAAVFSCGSTEKSEKNKNSKINSGIYNSAVSGQIVEITGKVRLVGSEPFSEMVITEAGKYDWYIENTEDRKLISSHQQEIVTIRGTVILKEMILADGKKLGSRKILSGISLIK